MKKRLTAFEEAEERIRFAVRLALDEPSRPVRIEEAARAAGYSPFHFQRLFSHLAGEPWAAFHRRLRLERAATQVQAGRVPVFQIALEAGFEGPEPFIRAFRAAYGSSPTVFRATRPEIPLLPTPNGLHAGNRVEAFSAIRKRGAAIEYRIEHRPELRLAGLCHRGPLQFISAAWLRLADWARQNGVELGERLLVTFAEDLDDEIPPEDLVGYVAIDDRMESGLEKYRIPPGDYLTARHVGPGNLLSDFWFRVYAEAVPQSGYVLKRAPAYQIYPDGLFAADPASFVTDIYVPLETA